MTNDNTSLTQITADALQRLTAKQAAREEALRLSREVIRNASVAIRAAHRNEMEQAKAMVKSTRKLVKTSRELLSSHPERS